MTILTGYTPDFALVGDYCAARWRDYCQINRIALVVESWADHGKPSSWNKLWAIRKLLTLGRSEVLWVDADSVPVGKLDTGYFMDDWYSAVDGYGLCNSHIFCRRTPDVLQLLDTMMFLGDPINYRLYHTERKWEQDTLKDLMFTYSTVANLVNFMPPEMVQHGSITMPGAAILHVPCLPLRERLEKLLNEKGQR